MSYVTVANMRPDTAAEFAQGITLTDAEAEDELLEAAITRLSNRLDQATNDHFESEDLTLDLTGNGTSRLELPKRCTAVTTVSILSRGSYTDQDTSVYLLRSSLYDDGSKRLDDLDWIDLLTDSSGLTGLPLGAWNTFGWPAQVRVEGTFGWTTTPYEAQRAVGLLVWDHFKQERGDLRRATRYSTSDLVVENSSTLPTGIPECDGIIAELKRGTGVLIR